MKPYRLMSLLPDPYFKEVFEDSPRKMRLAVLGVSGAKRKKKRRSLKSELASKEKEQEKALQAAKFKLSEEDMDRFSEEVIRNHLAKTPEMLIKFLNFMGVEHQGGYTDDMSFVETAPMDKVKEAVDLLASEFPLEKVVLYLCYIELKGVTEVDKVRETLLSWGWDPDQEEEEEEEGEEGQESGGGSGQESPRQGEGDGEEQEADENGS